MDPIVQDEIAQRSLALSNAGTAPLEIKTVQPSRFCRGIVDPTTIAPGVHARLDVTCRSDLYGPLNEHLIIHSNDPSANTTSLDLVANVTPILAFDAQTVDLQMPFGEERSQEVRLSGTLAETAEIKLKSPNVADVDIEPLNATPDKARGFRIHCRGRKPGMNVGNLIIATSLERPSEVAMPYACKVKGTLEVSPTNPYFNLKVSGPKVLFVDVRSAQPHFGVQSVHVLEGPFGASFEHSATSDAFRVKVWVLDDQIDDETRSVTGKLVIVSNDRTEPTKELPLFGFGQVNRATPLEPEH